MLRAGIMIDAWKLGIFERHLKAAGYAYTQGPGITKGTLLLKVDTEDAKALEAVVRAANEETALSRKGGGHA